MGGITEAPDLFAGFLVQGHDARLGSAGRADHAVAVDQGRFAIAPAGVHLAAEILAEAFAPDFLSVVELAGRPGRRGCRGRRPDRRRWSASSVGRCCRSGSQGSPTLALHSSSPPSSFRAADHWALVAIAHGEDASPDRSSRWKSRRRCRRASRPAAGRLRATCCSRPVSGEMSSRLGPRHCGQKGRRRLRRGAGIDGRRPARGDKSARRPAPGQHHQHQTDARAANCAKHGGNP